VTLFTWGVWAVMLFTGLQLIWRFGSNVPSWDDWDLVPTVTGNQPVTADWLWSQHNEHRVPVPRLLMLAVLRLTVLDFRSLMYFNVLAMAALASAMMLAAKRLRGNASYADAFFPLVLLSWGQAANLLWGWQLQFFSSALLAGVALLAIVGVGAGTRTRAAVVVVGTCTVLLTLCGANGLGMVPALAGWLLYMAYDLRRSGEPGALRTSAVAVGLAAAAVALTLLYFVGYKPVPYHPRTAGLLATINTSAKFLTIGLGPGVRGLWPWSGIAMLLTLLLTVLLLVRVWLAQPAERRRAAGLLLFLGALGSLALALGLGRNGFETRYITLAVPVWCGVYFAWSIYGSRAVNASARGALLLTTLALFWPNTQFGENYARDLRNHLLSFERDVAAGIPPFRLVQRHAAYLHPHHDIPTDYMPMLRQAGVGWFRMLRDDPPFREVPIPLVPAELHDATWQDSTIHSLSATPYVEFELPQDQYTAGLRMTYQQHNADGTEPYVSVYWARLGEKLVQHHFTEEPWARFRKYSPTGDRANWPKGTWLRLNDPGATMTVWMDDIVGRLRIYPDSRPGTFRITKLVLLVPADSTAR
jgi:hypothetical protein